MSKPTRQQLCCLLITLIGCCGWAQSQPTGLFKDAQRLSAVLRSLDSLRTTVFLEGADSSYFWEGKNQSLGESPLVLSRPGRYTFSPAGNDPITIRVKYGNDSISLSTPGDLQLLFSADRTDVYSDDPGADPSSVQTLEHFPDALYLLADYLEPGGDPQALDRLLTNPFLRDELGPWLQRRDQLGQRLRAHRLKNRQAGRDSVLRTTPSPVPDASIYKSTVPTAPERLQSASEALYANQPNLSGGINQTAVIEGLAAFIERRAQEELNLLFLERMRQQLETSRFGILFPKTLDLFTQFEVDQYRSMLDNAYPSFRQDLQEIGLNFPRLLREDTTLQHLRYNPRVLNAAHFLEFTNLALLGNEPDSIIRRASQVYRDESEAMRQMWRSTFMEQVRDPSFQRTVLEPLQKEVEELNRRERTIQAIYGVMETYADPDSLAGSDAIPGRRFLAQRIKSVDAALQNEKYFLSRDRPASLDRYSYLARLFANPDRGALFEGATLADYQTYIARLNSDSLFAAELVRMAERVLEPRTQHYQLEGLASAKKWYQELSLLHRRALELEQRGLLARGLRALQIDHYLRSGLAAERDFWQSSGLQPSMQDTLALRFFEEVLHNEQQTNRIENLITDFLKSTTPFRFKPDLSAQLADIESFQDSLLVLLEPHLNQLNQLAPGSRPTLMYGEYAGHLAAWDELIDIQTEKVTTIQNNGDLDDIDDLASQAGQQYQALRSGQVSALSAITTDTEENPFLAKAYALQNIPPVTLPDDLLLVVDQLDSLVIATQTNQANLVRLQARLDQQLNKQADQPFLRAAENAEKLRAISELTMTLVESFRYTDTLYQEEVVTEKRGQQVLTTRPTTDGMVTATEQRDTLLTRRVPVQRIRHWMPPEMLDAIMSDQHDRRAFLGLLYQRISAIDGLPVAPESLGLLAVQTVELLEATRNARELAQLRRDSTGKSSLMDYLPVARGVLRLFSTALNAPLENGTLAQAMGLETVGGILENSLGTYEYLAQDQFGYALTSTMGLYQSFAQNEEEEKNDRVSAFNLQQNVLRYGHFVADIVDARSPDQVQSILQSYASPVGTSRLKRNNAFNVSLNAYLGPSVAYEVALGNEVDESGIVTSLSTPIGLALSWRNAKERENDLTFRSWTALISVLDIAPVLSYNFGQGALASTPDLSVGDFVAPGLFLFYNLPRSPFSGGFGYQQTAAVRTISMDGIETRNYRAGRFTLFLGIDVPVFSLFTKP